MGVHGVDEKRLGGVVVRSEDLGGALELAHVRLDEQLDQVLLDEHNHLSSAGGCRQGRCRGKKISGVLLRTLGKRRQTIENLPFQP